jgi:hypothetical protein
MMIQALKPMGNQQETLLSQNCSSMEIYISSKETFTAANYTNKIKYMMLENKANN